MQEKDVNKLIADIFKIIREVSKRQRKSFYEENKILSIIGENPLMQPRECALIYDERYGLTIENNIMTGDYVISILKKSLMGHINERQALYQKAERYASDIISLLSANSSHGYALDKLNIGTTASDKFKRLVMLYIASRWEHLHNSDECKLVMKLNKSFLAECLDSIIDCINDFYSETEIDSYKRELILLERKLKIANKTIESLQDSFEEELSDCKAEEQRILISKLNSEKYGYLLDMIDNAQNGLKELRKKRIDIPYEIASVSIIIRNLLKFVADCDITPIMEKGDIITVNAQDAERFIYEGTPFYDDVEEKKVKIISTGWEIKSRGIVISNPRIKEIKEDYE